MALEPTSITVLGQVYILDVQTQTLQNVDYQSEIMTFARFREIVATAYAEAEEAADLERMAEALKSAQDFANVLGAAPNASLIPQDATPAEPTKILPRRSRDRARDR